MIKISKIFPHLSIRSKLIIAFVGLSVLPLVFVSIYGLHSNVSTMKRVAMESLTHDVQNIRERTSNFMTGVESDISVLSNSHLFERYVRSIEGGSSRGDDSLLSQMADELVAFATTKRLYYQLRIINEDRDEVLRVECSGMLDSTLIWRVCPSDSLHRGGESYYFMAANNLPPGKIAFSPVELSYRGETRVPVISFWMPLARRGGRVGILVANVFARDLFEEMQPARTLGVDEKVVLVAGDGHYLYVSDERSQWNKLIATREEDNLQKDYPPGIARLITSDEEGTVTEGTDDIIAHAPLFPVRAGARRAQPVTGLSEPLFVFESVPIATITSDARSFALTFLAFLFLFLVGAVVLGLLATQQFTRPISELQRGAAIIAGGHYNERLRVTTGDEIEELAKQFNAMAASLEAHDFEIRQHRTHLESMVERRTREVVDEKEKLQAILDNVASAFVVLDREHRIQTASAAFGSITGLRLEDVTGQDSRQVLWSNGICERKPFEGDVLPDKIESHVDHSVDPSGAERYIEHVTVPITKDGEVASLLQIITDITKRTRLEQNLIQSEKLMATGEMSAIIAHGFRNSLTSIKMILQLQHESKQLSGANRRSLEVALDSIYRMETMVQELLNFARPSPMEFREGSLNELVDDCLALVGPTITKRGIEVRKNLDPDLPAVRFDAPHLKEAMVNILLNALQAMEGGPPQPGNGSLEVYSKKVVLAKTLRDFNPPDARETGNGVGAAGGNEITLRKGTGCAVVGIRDGGPGIDRALLSRIFDPFFTTKTNGTGLGLPMVKRTVNAHGGIVAVKSARGSGVTFEIVLPLRRIES